MTKSDEKNGEISNLTAGLIGLGFTLVDHLGREAHALEEMRYIFLKSALDTLERFQTRFSPEKDPIVEEATAFIRSLFSELMGALVLDLSEEERHGDLQEDYMRMKGSQPEKALRILLQALLSGDATRQVRVYRIVTQLGIPEGASRQTTERFKTLLSERAPELSSGLTSQIAHTH